jgi:hypothetical protein
VDAGLARGPGLSVLQGVVTKCRCDVRPTLLIESAEPSPDEVENPEVKLECRLPHRALVEAQSLGKFAVRVFRPADRRVNVLDYESSSSSSSSSIPNASCIIAKASSRRDR